MSLTGTWEGHYFSNWITGDLAPADETSEWAFGIRLEVSQVDDRLKGKMTDLRTVAEIESERWFNLLEKRMDWLTRAENKRWLASHRNAILRIELPAFSTIEGNISGNEIKFKKTYEGFSCTSWVIGEVETTTKRPAAEVFYSGELDRSLTLIKGKYQVVEQLTLSSGLFQLRKLS